MEQKRITEEAIQAFRQYLILDEKSAVTVEKYLRDVRAFQAFIGETPVEKELVIHYKNHLLEESYAVRSINSMLASVNSFLIFMDWPDCKVKSLKVQRQIYCAEEKELTKAEYERLLRKVANKIESEHLKAIAYHDTVAPKMEEIRYQIDKLELIVADELWTLPKYRELLFIR